MQLLKWIHNLFKSQTTKRPEQTYRDDQKYRYILIFITDTDERRFRTFSTSSPLSSGDRIVLTDQKSFIVKNVAHVVYPVSESTKLTRPTTFVHVLIAPSPESIIHQKDLVALDFEIMDLTHPYTIH